MILPDSGANLQSLPEKLKNSSKLRSIGTDRSDLADGGKLGKRCERNGHRHEVVLRGLLRLIVLLVLED